MTVSVQSILGLKASHGRLEDRANNFTAMRAVFAFMVILSHSFIIPLGLPLTAPGMQFIDSLAQGALDGFFILSGYMLTAGLLRGQDLKSYSVARVLRIFPGMIAVILPLWLIAAPLLTSMNLAEYLGTMQTWVFPVLVIAQIDPQAGLPGVFAANPFQSLDGPLWTIRYELYCYLAAGGLAALGLWRSRNGVVLIAVGAALFSIVHAAVGYTGPLDATIGAGARFGGAFMMGALLFALRDKVGLSLVPALLLIGVAVLAQGTPAGMILKQLALAYGLLWLGFLHIPGRLGERVRNLEDLSYGLYIIHWPIGQIAVHLMPAIAPMALFGLMTALTLPLAWVLRVLVEKPATALKGAITGWSPGLRAARPLQPRA